jgi:exodeoxyribonuclease-3
MGDAMQGALFGFAPTAAVEESVAGEELRVCALNVQSAGASRARPLASWLVETQCNVLALTELRAGEGARPLLDALREEGYDVVCTVARDDERYVTAVTTRGFDVARVVPEPDSARILAVDLSAAGRSVRLVTIYAPTNGMTPDSSTARAAFQRRCLDYLASIRTPGFCVVGDLNVLDSTDQPCASVFERHDFEFYAGLLALGVRDTHRALHPEATQFSWVSDRLGAQRLDYAFADAAAGSLVESDYDHTPRRQNLSDHAAVRTVLRFAPEHGGATPR